MRYCRSCKHFVEMKEQLTGECRWLPLIHYVEPGYWCGQYKQRPKNKEEKEEKPTLDTKSFILGYADEYKRIYGVQYVVDWIKDTAAAKTLLKEHDPETAKKFCKAFLTDPPKWNIENKMLGLSQVPRLRNKLSLKEASTSGVQSPKIEESKEHANSVGWPDYVDYIRKGGNKTFKEWVD